MSSSVATKSSSGDMSSVKSLKSALHGWREICVIVNRVLRWEQPYHPAVIFGVTTAVFTFIWYMDPSFITGISMFLVAVCVLDYIVPFASPMLFPEANWNALKEKEFGLACSNIELAKSALFDTFDSLKRLKKTNPWLYVAVVTVGLSTLAWFGKQMHNLLLLYFSVLGVTAIPGLVHHGLAKRGMSYFERFVKKAK